MSKFVAGNFQKFVECKKIIVWLGSKAFYSLGTTGLDIKGQTFVVKAVELGRLINSILKIGEPPIQHALYLFVIENLAQ